MSSLNSRRGIAPVILIVVALVVLGGGIAAFLLMKSQSPPPARLPAGQAGGLSAEVPAPPPPVSQGQPVPGGTVPEMVVTPEEPPAPPSGGSLGPRTTEAPPEEHVVRYTENGFSPNSLLVMRGDTVRFVNESSHLLWVASAPHPTHTNYPAFDARRAYAPGEVYSFTFTETGEWKYHNHRNVSFGGSISVSL
ncbi:MAG: hypothetical protein AAB601_02360 [Patescibacteria group bacterium]